MILKEEFLAWKQSELYQEFDNTIREQIGNLSAEIVGRTSSNAERDMFVRGAVQALVSVLEWVPTFPEEEEPTGEDDEV